MTLLPRSVSLLLAAVPLLSFLVTACASSPEPGASPPEGSAPAPLTDARTSRGAPSPGKPTAPIRVSVDLQDRRAVVTVTVEREARDVEVTVRGLDGVTVTAPTAPVRAATAAAGQKIVVDTSFTAAAPDGALVVQVEGTFGGRQLGAVRTFSLGKPPAAGEKAPPRTDASGRPIVVMPAY